MKTNDKAVSHRDRILAAASEVFLASGFERASTAEIAGLARISKRELYLHFADKRTLLAAVVDDFQDEMQVRMNSVWTSGDAIEDVLLQSAKGIQRFIISERFGKLMRIVAGQSYQSPEIAKQFFRSGPNAGRKASARYFKQQMKLGHLRKAEPLEAADDFLNLVVGSQMLTAVFLGQSEHITPKTANTRHAVEAFLTIYRPDASRRAKGGRRSIK